jgi:hypothetical protein
MGGGRADREREREREREKERDRDREGDRKGRANKRGGRQDLQAFLVPRLWSLSRQDKAQARPPPCPTSSS